MAWYHRRLCLDKININLQEELNWLDLIGVENQKNYQIWQHRKIIVERTGDYSHEKIFLNQVFEDEPKNFHAWCHRIWIVRRFGIYEGEIDFVESILKEVILNKSRMLETILLGIIGFSYLIRLIEI